jgi:hypothetical protein
LLDDEHRQDAITRPGDWGTWINGGGWLKIDDMAVDILFRETKNVIAVIEDCVDGNITIDYQCGSSILALSTLSIWARSYTAKY